MINAKKQSWTIGSEVKVGFMTLRVASIELTPGDYRPDKYHLVNEKNGNSYVFTPHYGLEKE